MTLPADIEQDLLTIAALPQADDIRDALTGAFNLASARGKGDFEPSCIRYSSLMIASDTIEDAERLAKVYISGINKLGITKEARVNDVEWKDVFTPLSGDDEGNAMYNNIRKAFADSAGGAMLVRAPYNGPAGKAPLQQELANYSATAELLYQMDKEEGWDKAFNALYKQGKTLGEIDRALGGKSFEDPYKPLVVVIGAKSDMQKMYDKEPAPWNMRFMKRIGVETPKSKYGF